MSDCGCKIVHGEIIPTSAGRYKREISIEYCPLHAAAPKMLEELKDILELESAGFALRSAERNSIQAVIAAAEAK